MGTAASRVFLEGAKMARRVFVHGVTMLRSKGKVALSILEALHALRRMTMSMHVPLVGACRNYQVASRLLITNHGCRKLYHHASRADFGVHLALFKKPCTIIVRVHKYTR